MFKYSAPAKQAHTPFPRYVLAYIAAYLYGSLPLVYLLGRQSGANLQQSGSGNVGAANLLAVGGIKRAVIGAFFDASKGWLPILTCRRLGYPEEAAELAGACGLVGQCWPIFLRFNGGRGLSAFLGASYLVNRRAWLLSLSLISGGFLWRFFSSFSFPLRKLIDRLKSTRSKSAPFGCLLGTLAFPLACYTDQRHERQQQPVPALLSLVILARRLTAPLPDDAIHGPAVHKKALLYRLLYDRNTSD